MRGTFKKLLASAPGRIGICGLALLFVPAVFASLISNGRPLFMAVNGEWSFPFLRYFFAPDADEVFVEAFFNYLSLAIPAWLILCVLVRKRKLRRWLVAIVAVLLLLPFCLASRRMDKTDYRALAAEQGATCIFAPIPFGPFEPTGSPYELPSKRHVLGCDEVGRDVASRMLYGARTSLSVVSWSITFC